MLQESICRDIKPDPWTRLINAQIVYRLNRVLTLASGGPVPAEIMSTDKVFRSPLHQKQIQ
jgi:hypothetical protein